ncbi:MAG: GspH/FimT family pseudopilin [Polaromonas sp.]|nr:GspH/FimT family pseudopilin [Polaromonas sp.]
MSRGFTLIELMVVITIAGVMLGIGVPSFKSFIAGQRVKTAAGDFSTAAIYARSEAIKRNAEVGLVAAAGGWKDGWSVKAGAVTLSQQAAFPALTMTSAVAEVVYLGSGRLKEQVLASSLQVAADGASSARCVSFELSGLPKSRLGNC